MKDKRFTLRKPDIDNDIDCEEIADNGEWITYGDVVDLLNEQDQQIKELEKTIKKLVIELFKPPCVNNNDNYETLRKFLKEEYDITCTQIDIDVENEKMVFKIEEEMKQ